ncbi:hypothetical protein SAMN05216203_0787 [Marinobacter daqiaonensis]|uniref:KANL3/Tex30 alpha/beta hydrolase-like domain-containing protein n=1 Tax=Marinobacter daqiaonensis TaxID=650891 RepID=A0A1I6H2S4_9GAMM|nr:alpha/beta family hydrolase [Marinobacter daqiaonensis]SFR48651.1 hypothetical protein SAMN05216203_0787 [Marinobacter daqiaonensis]
MSDWIFSPALHSTGPAPVVLLAHGAGAGCRGPFMDTLAKALATNGLSVARFEFPYMQKFREDGRKRPPDRRAVLLDCFERMVADLRREIGTAPALLVGGKSMGGRMASLLAADPDRAKGIDGVMCFGYPFHPPGRPDRWRTGHLGDLQVPMAVFQGTRDPFGRPEELACQPPLPGRVTVHWLEGGNHDLRPLKRQGIGEDELILQAARGAADFVAAMR